MKHPKKTRMCIKCKKRLQQIALLRLQYRDGGLSAFSGGGRSFYVCKGCVKSPNIIQSILKIGKFKIDEHHIQALKEILTVWAKYD